MDGSLGDKAYCSGVHFSLSDVAAGSVQATTIFVSPVQWRDTVPNSPGCMTTALRPSFDETQAG
jgi:glutathione S-transferase